MGGLVVAAVTLSFGCGSVEWRVSPVPSREEITVSRCLAPLGPVERPVALEALADAKRTWQSALDDTVRFRHAEREGATVHVRFVRRLRLAGEPVAGYIRWTPEGEGPVEVTVAVRDEQNRPLTRRQVTAAVAHELGHVLGLEDGGDGLMGRLDRSRPVLAPTLAEVAALRQLRSER